jgi:hypothetical protein
VRKEWEFGKTGLTEIWGYDLDEQTRANNIVEQNPHCQHYFPLIDEGITKSEAHGILERLGIERPKMYDLGYLNNNCICCVKAGMGCWNKYRVDFPEKFEWWAKFEREIGQTVHKDKDGKIFLDELDPERGDDPGEIMPECGIACWLNTYQVDQLNGK